MVRLAPDVAVFTVVLAALSITLFEWTSRIFLASYEQSALFARVVRFVEVKDGESCLQSPKAELKGGAGLVVVRCPWPLTCLSDACQG